MSSTYHIFYSTYKLVMEEQMLCFIFWIWSCVKHATDITGNCSKSFLSCILFIKNKEKGFFPSQRNNSRTSASKAIMGEKYLTCNKNYSVLIKKEDINLWNLSIILRTVSILIIWSLASQHLITEKTWEISFNTTIFVLKCQTGNIL